MHTTTGVWRLSLYSQKNLKKLTVFNKVGRYFYFRQISTHIVTISTTLMLVLVNDDDEDDDDGGGGDDDKRSNLLATVLKHVIPSHAVETVLSLLFLTHHLVRHDISQSPKTLSSKFPPTSWSPWPCWWRVVRTCCKVTCVSFQADTAAAAILAGGELFLHGISLTSPSSLIFGGWFPNLFIQRTKPVDQPLFFFHKHNSKFLWNRRQILSFTQSWPWFKHTWIYNWSTCGYNTLYDLYNKENVCTLPAWLKLDSKFQISQFSD